MKFSGKQVLTALSVKYGGSFDDVYNAIKRKEKLSDEDIEKCSRLSENAIAIIDEDYPNVCRQSTCTPIILFVKGGKRSLLDSVSNSGVAVFDDGGIVYGAGEMVHDLLENGKTIVVPDFGQGTVLIENKNNFLIVSEYPEGAYDKSSSKQHMRLVQVAVALCNTVLIGAYDDQDKAKFAAGFALRDEREVKVIPMGLDKKGYVNDALIKEGADVALTWEDVLPEQTSHETGLA